MGEGTAALDRQVCVTPEEVAVKGDRADRHADGTQPTDPLTPQSRQAPLHATLSTKGRNSWPRQK